MVTAYDIIMGPLVATLMIGISTLLFLYWYATRNFNYWKKRGIPYIIPLPFVGSVLDNIKKPIHEVELDRYVKYGSLYGYFEGNRPLLSVGDPNLVRDILVKDFQTFPKRRDLSVGEKIVDNMVSNLDGEDWKRVRSIITPTFSTGKIRRMLCIIKDCSETLIQNFKTAASKGEPVEVKKIYGAFTMDIIASTAFSTKLDSHNDPENKFVRTAKNVFGSDLSWRFGLLQLFPRVVKMFKVSILSPEATKFFKEVTLQIIKERKRTGQKRNDFLQLMMDCSEECDQKCENGDKETGDIALNYGEENNQIFKTVPKKNISLDELVAQCVIFFLAGYDTTGSTLSLATYLLALNPDVQEKVYEEIEIALQNTNGKLTYESIQEMKYLDNVISETLRLYPPAIRVERVAENNYKLGSTGITIPKGMLVSIPVFALQRDAKYFPEPEKFNPDRFSAQERAKRDPYTYLPFGSGPRNCVGMRFALMEVKICLAYVLSTFKVKRCSQTQVPLEFAIGQGLIQPKDILLELEPRQEKILSV